MKLIGLEEHFVTGDVLAAWEGLDPQWQDVALKQSDRGDTGKRLLDLGDGRFAASQDAGFDVQVLSLTAPGTEPGVCAGRRVADRIKRCPRTYGTVKTRSLPGIGDARHA